MNDADSPMRTDKYRWPAILLFFVMGLLIGRWTADHREPAIDSAKPSGLLGVHSGDVAPRSDSASGTGEDEATSRLAFEDLLRENLGSSEGEIAQFLGRFGGDPSEIAGVIIGSMTEEELISSLTSFTDISPEKIKDASEPHAYANRLVELAMEGLIHQPASEGGKVEQVHFSERSASEEERQLQLTSFTGNDRILARFPMKDYEGSEVFVKWTRVDDPEIMLFNHYPIKPDAAFNYVWLEPKDGWEPGDYQVNFYTADEKMTPLATGRYVIDLGN